MNDPTGTNQISPTVVTYSFSFKYTPNGRANGIATMSWSLAGIDP